MNELNSEVSESTDQRLNDSQELTNSTSTMPIKGVSITPPMTGTYTCSIQMWSGNNYTVSNDVRFYSVRCGWLKGNNEVITEADLK